MVELIFLSNKNGEPNISICKYDKERCCGCATKSVLSEDKTHYRCGKCGAMK